MTRVLIVDDDEGSREAMHAVLDDAGYEVTECDNGLACLAILSASRDPLVVLLDYRMPRMSGAEVLRAAAERKLAHRPIALCCSRQAHTSWTSLQYRSLPALWSQSSASPSTSMTWSTPSPAPRAAFS